MMHQRFVDINPIIREVKTRKSKEQLFAEMEQNNYSLPKLIARAAQLGLSQDPDVKQYISSQKYKYKQQLQALQQQRTQQLGRSVQELTTPQTRVKQPQTMLGKGPVAEAVHKSGIGGYITSETDAQTPLQLGALLAQKGYTPEESEPFVEMMRNQQGTQQQEPAQKQVQSPDAQIEKDVKSAGGLKTLVGVQTHISSYKQLAEKSKNKTKLLNALRNAISSGADDKTVQLQKELNISTEDLSRLPQLIAKENDNIAYYNARTKIGEKIQAQLQKEKEDEYIRKLREKPPETDFISYLNTKYSPDVVATILRIPERIQREREAFLNFRKGFGDTVGGDSAGVAVPPSGSGEATFMMDGVEYKY